VLRHDRTVLTGKIAMRLPKTTPGQIAPFESSQIGLLAPSSLPLKQVQGFGNVTVTQCMTTHINVRNVLMEARRLGTPQGVFPSPVGSFPQLGLQSVRLPNLSFRPPRPQGQASAHDHARHGNHLGEASAATESLLSSQVLQRDHRRL